MLINIDGFDVLVDECDVHLLMERKKTWRVRKFTKLKHSKFYVSWGTQVKYRPKLFLLHRVIMGAKDGQVVDHINGNTMDNRRCNLRCVTNFENMKNMPKRSSPTSSRFKGVSKIGDRWKAKIMYNRKEVYLGIYHDEVEAAFAYDTANIKYHGEFGRRNFLPLVF